MSQFYLTSPGGSSVIPINFNVDVNDPGIGPLPADAGTVNAVANDIRIGGGNGIQTYKTSTPGDLLIAFVEGSGTTPGAATASAVFTVPTDSTETYQVLVSGYSNLNTSIGAYGSVVVKNVAGTASIIGVPTLAVHKEASLAAGNVTFGVSGADFLVTVTGVAGNNINWSVVLPGISGVGP